MMSLNDLKEHHYTTGGGTSYSTSYSYHRTTKTAGLPCLHRGRPLLSPPFFLFIARIRPPSLFSGHPSRISSPRVPLPFPAAFSGLSIRLSYHYPSSVSSIFFALQNHGKYMIFQGYFLPPIPHICLFSNACHYSTSPAHSLGTPLRGQVLFFAYSFDSFLYMSRPLRIEYEGALYHVTSRGNAGRDIFVDEKDRGSFVETIASVVNRYRFIIHAYCLMTNHYHLMVETPEGNLAAGMRQINGAYSQRFNHRHGTKGHLMQGRYKAFVVEKEGYLLELSRYIVMNPVRAGMVSSPRQWQWSSYCATAGIKEKEKFLHTGWILDSFSSSRAQAHRLYREFVQEMIGEKNPLRGARGGIILGSEHFIEQHRELLEKILDKEVVRGQRYAARPSLKQIFGGTKRDVGISEAVHRWGYKLKEIGDFLGLHYSRVSRIASIKAKSKT
jgi:putative transposase